MKKNCLVQTVFVGKVECSVQYTVFYSIIRCIDGESQHTQKEDPIFVENWIECSISLFLLFLCW